MQMYQNSSRKPTTLFSTFATMTGDYTTDREITRHANALRYRLQMMLEHPSDEPTKTVAQIEQVVSMCDRLTLELRHAKEKLMKRHKQKYRAMNE